jgi:hypothetical protein
MTFDGVVGKTKSHKTDGSFCRESKPKSAETAETSPV